MAAALLSNGGSIAPGDEALLRNAAGTITASRAASTMSKYHGPFSRFCEFAAARGYGSLPAQPLHILLFLQQELQRCSAAGLTYAPIRSASAAISTMHSIMGLQPNPCDDSMIQQFRTGAMQKLGLTPINRKEPLLLETVLALAEMWAGEHATLWELTLAAYVMLAFAGFLRYSDAALISVRHFRVDSRGNGTLFLLKRKNDQFRRGSEVPIAAGKTAFGPVQLALRLIKSADLADDAPLFQGPAPAVGGRPDGGLSGSALEYGILRSTLLSGLVEVTGLSLAEVTTTFGTHSLRSGGATGAARAEVAELDFQRHGGWKSRQAMLAYVLPSEVALLGVSGALGY